MIHPASSPSSPRELITRLEAIIDALLADEREEQEAILNRQTNSLPVICGRIDQRTLEFNRLQGVLAEVWPAQGDVAPGVLESSRRTFDKLKNLQQLTIQNHLLLEHHLNFLKEIHREVLGINRKPFLYDDTGLMEGEWAESGALLDAKA